MSQLPNYINPPMMAQQMYSNYIPQQPYIDRYAQNQQMMSQPNQQMLPTQMSGTSQQVQGVNGRIVDDFGAVSANDVPMDAMGAFFIKSDGTEIQRRVWNANGMISTISFKPVLEEQADNLPHGEEKLQIDLSEASTEAFMKRFDEITDRLDKMEKSFGKTTSRTKKESGAE